MVEHPPSDSPAWLLEALDVLLQAGRGLAAAHAVELVHRDFKPSNVLVGNDGRVRVVDFGLARDALQSSGSEATGERSVSASSEQVTRTGTVVGTPAYMAPEQSEGRALDGRTDQYAFCLTAWEVLFGTRPEAGDAERPEASVVTL
jgi:serine/threonine protein kinase